jgi:hypothetical protein
MIWASLARSLSGFSSCKLSIAFKPNGVAAESNPKKFGSKFNVIYEIEGGFWDTKTLLPKLT